MSTNVVNIPGKYTWTQFYPNGSIYAQQEYVGGYDHFSETRTDPDGYPKPKPPAWLFPKVYSLSTQKYRVTNGVIHYIQPNGFSGIMSGNLGALVDNDQVPLFPPLSSSESRESVIKALTKLKKQRVNLGVALAEAQQTANFVGDTALRLTKSATSLMAGKPKEAFARLGGANYRDYPKGWLGWNYAALPLLGDVYGSMQALSERQNLSDWVVTVKGVTRRVWTETLVFQNQPNVSGGTIFTDEIMRGYFTRLDYIPDNTFLTAISSLGVSNPLEVLWEKIPFSFVIDWMVPVGDWISTFDAAYGWKFLSGSQTRRLEVKRKITPARLPLSSGNRQLREEWEGNRRRLSIERSLYGSSPIVPAPRVKNPLSLGHMANGLSLLTQVLNRASFARWRI